MNLLVNGITNNDYMDLENQLVHSMKDNTHYFKLRDMKINYCQGCWDCWVKTPGRCLLKDDYEQILSKISSSDSITIVTPLIAGYVTHLIKTFHDRMIPIVHPYIIEHKKEQHHRQRYGKSPTFKIIILEDEFTTQDDIDGIRDYYNRVVLNFHSEVVSFISVKKGDDISYVIDSI